MNSNAVPNRPFRYARTFAVWLAINEPQLITRFVSLPPEQRGDSFLDFARQLFTEDNTHAQPTPVVAKGSDATASALGKALARDVFGQTPSQYNGPTAADRVRRQVASSVKDPYWVRLLPGELND